eukprot:6284258-Pyramimonas_sp.AAC.1
MFARISWIGVGPPLPGPRHAPRVHPAPTQAFRADLRKFLLIPIFTPRDGEEGQGERGGKEAKGKDE